MIRLMFFVMLASVLFCSLGCRSQRASPVMTESVFLPISTPTAPSTVAAALLFPSATLQKPTLSASTAITTVTALPVATPTTLPTETATAEPTSGPKILLPLEKSTQKFTSHQTFQAALGDLDGDGDLDAVFANPQKNNAQVWLNDGSGVLADTGQKLTQYGHGAGLADFDGDGDLDAFIACHQFITASKTYLNDGGGNFQDTGQDLGDRNISAVEVNLLDLNGDGHVDVHVAYYDPAGLPDKVYLNDGQANFSDSGLALDEDTIAWGDLDSDGDVDYFGKRWGLGYLVQRNDGHGQFSSYWQMGDIHATMGGVALADFDQDGDLDALVTNGFRDTGSFPSLLLWNDGAGQFIDSGWSLNETMGAEVAVGDLDNDGDLDVFVANMDRPDEVWLKDDTLFVDSGLRLGKNSDMSGKPSLGDLDGDGDLDMVIGRFNGGAEIWTNLTGHLSTQVSLTPTPTPVADSFFEGLRVTYVWNAGFLITAGDRRILIDALYEGNPAGILKPILESRPPFDGVDLILATHEHVDHFSSALVRQYMLANANTVFLSTQNAARQLLALGDDLRSRVVSIDIGKGESSHFEANGIAVEAIYLSHGIPNFLNLGFVITIGEVTLFHTGDIDVETVPVAELQAYRLPERRIDVAFVPYFFFTDEVYQDYVLDGIQARYLIPMHFYGRLSLSEGVESTFPGYFIFSDSYESWAMPADER